MKPKFGPLKCSTNTNKLLHTLYKKKRKFKLLKLGMKEKASLLVFQKERVIKEYCKQLYANKLDNLDEMGKFLERQKLPKLTKEEIENLYRPITGD